MRIICLLFMIFGFSTAFSQWQLESNWLFGWNNQLQITQEGVQLENDNGPVYSTEGSASISDEQGNLLFSTNGSNIFDANGNPMPGGNQVQGDDSSTQNNLIVPQPGDTLQRFYYVFGVPAQLDVAGGFQRPHLEVLTVDMQANGGMGAVIGTPEVLMEDAPEMLHAVYHSNQRDVWVVSHQANTNLWYAFEVNCEGIQDPIISEEGRDFIMNPGMESAIGSLKLSPNGQRVACTYNEREENGTAGRSFLIWADFNSTTGEISNAQEIVKGPENVPQGYGVGFSPSSEVLYWCILGNPCFWYQYDLLAEDLESSEYLVASDGQPYASMVIGPDSKIYTARGGGAQYLSGLQFPDLLGPACGFTEEMVPLTSYSLLGVPNNWMYPYPTTEVLTGTTDLSLCDGQTQLLDVQFLPGVTFVWQDGSTGYQYLAEEPGIYVAEGYEDCYLLSRWTFVVDEIPAPELQIIQPDAACADSLVSVELISDVIWQWEDGSLEQTRSLQTNQRLSYQAEGCTWTDSTDIEFQNLPSSGLSSLNTACFDEVIRLKIDENSSFDFEWEDGSTDFVREFTEGGLAQLTMWNTCGETNEQFEFVFEECFCEVYVPNAFTPNLDGVNDLLELKTACDVSNLQFQIFNRWGELVFQSSEREAFWNGSMNQGTHFVPDGVYMYRLTFNDHQDLPQKKQGHITLIR